MQQPNFYTSSIGRKLVMAATGIFLMAFLAVHLGLNATMLVADGGVSFDRLAELLRRSWWLHGLEIAVLSGIFIHAGQGIWLTWQNRSHRPTPYATIDKSGFDPARSMGLLGSVIAVFLVLHLYQLWLPHTFGLATEHSLYQLAIATFSHGWVVAIYLLGCAAVAAHLWHGWRSALITFGLDDRSIHHWQSLGIACAILLPLGLAAIPLALWLISHFPLPSP